MISDGSVGHMPELPGTPNAELTEAVARLAAQVSSGAPSSPMDTVAASLRAARLADEVLRQAVETSPPIGLFLKVITFPLTVLTLGIFWIVVNAIVLKLSTWFVPGFKIYGFWPAFWGALVLSIINMLFRWLMPRKEERHEY